MRAGRTVVLAAWMGLAIWLGRPGIARGEDVKLPAFGVTFTMPADTTFELTDTPTDLGLWKFSPTSPAAGAALMVEIAPGKGKAVGDVAAGLGGLAVQPGKFTIGGETAAKVMGDVSGPSHLHRISYLVIHKDWLYVFSALSRQGSGDPSKPLDDVIGSAKFIPLESPVKHLTELFDQPMTILGLFTMNGPNMLRRWDNEENELGLGMADFTDGSKPVSIDIQAIQIPGAKSFTDLRDAYTAGLEKTFHLTEHFKWTVSEDVHGLSFTQPLKCLVKQQDGLTHTFYTRYCILDLGHGKLVQLVFTTPPSGNDETDKAYNDVAEQMLKTIKILPAATATTRP